MVYLPTNRVGVGVLGITAICCGAVLFRINNKTEQSIAGTSSNASKFYDKNEKSRSAVFCNNNANDPLCCSPDHCDTIVRRSTLFSECCENLPVKPNATVATTAKKRTKRATISMTRVIPILITGTPHSGTAFIKTLLRTLGLSAVDDMHTPTPSVKAMVSWIHVVQENENNRRTGSYYGPARLYGSKFQHMWHQVRDPLQTLTSIAFTEPLVHPEKVRSENTYIRFLQRHITLTPAEQLKTIIRHNNIQQTKSASLDQYEEQQLIYRALEFFSQWQTFILALRIPKVSLEHITIDHNVKALQDIFRAVGKDPPSRKHILRVLTSLQRRRQLQRILQQGQPSQKQHQEPPEPMEPRIPRQQGIPSRQKMPKGLLRRKRNINTQKHRPTLRWDELCHVSVNMTQQFLQASHELGYYHEKQSVC